jgi:hypothetical protein
MQIQKHSVLEKFFTTRDTHHDAQEFLSDLLCCFYSNQREEIHKIFGVTAKTKCTFCSQQVEQNCININFCGSNLEYITSHLIGDINVSCPCQQPLKFSIVNPPSILVKCSFS